MNFVHRTTFVFIFLEIQFLTTNTICLSEIGFCMKPRLASLVVTFACTEEEFKRHERGGTAHQKE